MGYVYSAGGADVLNAGRPMVKALFVASCLLSIVSWYTTMQGMALYLSTWFALLASLGVQSALLLVAWLVGFSRTRRALLVSVYIITAVVSVAFSYVSLYTWFSARERPAQIERKLYDTLGAATQKTEEILAAAAAEGRKHVAALDELTVAERTVGHVSRAEDADPYLRAVREAVAREAQTYAASYREGAGEGLRYTAFERYSKLARQSLEQIEAARQAMAGFRAQARPLTATEKQLRDFHQAYDSIPWPDVERTLHAARLERPQVPEYAAFVDQSVSGQEDLLVAFQELVTAPTYRHGLAFALAAFIDIIVFLLAYASGPYFFGAPERRWQAAAAALDSADDQVFARDFLRKVTAASSGMASVEVSSLSPGELQYCLLLASKGLAAVAEEERGARYLLDPQVHESLIESLASQGMPLRAARGAAAV